MLKGQECIKVSRTRTEGDTQSAGASRAGKKNRQAVVRRQGNAASCIPLGGEIRSLGDTVPETI